VFHEGPHRWRRKARELFDHPLGRIYPEHWAIAAIVAGSFAVALWDILAR
jgi:hypothetical protein